MMQRDALIGEPMVRLTGVAKRYGGGVIALDTLDLDVMKGEFVALLGPSGSGKTTLLNIIAGMTPPSRGSIHIAGDDMTHLPPSKRNLGMVFQNYALLPHMSVYENVAFPLRVRKLAEKDIVKKVEAVLDLVQLGHAKKRLPRELSGGQQQRVSLARCIVYDPSLILMDEPLGALDKKLREQMQSEIKRLHKTLGTTILYVTHDQEEALSMADRIVLFHQGRIVQQASPADLYFKPRSVFAANFLGASNILSTTAVGDGIAQLKSGETIRIGSGAAVINNEPVMILVRPECLRIERYDETSHLSAANSVPGQIVSSTILGNVTNHHVLIADGHTVMAQELTRRTAHDWVPGEQVKVTWAAADTRALEPDEMDVHS
ncbi:ABC transporter ATP-binding protein [Microvirga pudoricolor]|uniref:ABC transporter ATP-binding protein n=1 Tax=Microvirga pudoricolor TaxID=2778729 RepID=UPI00194F4A4F|nr:ABC transporter ATP-binding protein [Microvirga pudoricolor]MBM6593106.1 ABC transporter ATP-binding protein [Microvirga pudoricolor]